MTILFLCNLVPRKLGAFEEFVCALGSALAQHDSRLHVGFAGEPSPAVVERLRQADVRWSVLPGWVQGETVHSWTFVGPALSLLRRIRPDVVAVHFGNELPTAMVILLARLSGLHACRWFWHQRQQIKDPSALTQHISRIRFLSWSCDHLVPLYDGGRRSMQERHVPEQKIRVIRNGVDASISTHAPGHIRRALRIPETSTVITMVSSLIPRKRVDLAIEAFSRLLEQREWEDRPALIVVGEGVEDERLQRLTHDAGIEPDVHFLGLRDDVPDILQDSDVALLTSEAEASPLAILQAMAAGMPAVVTDAGAAREMVLDGRTGFIVHADPDDIARALAVLVADPSRRQAMGRAARQHWQENYTLELSVRAHMQLYGVLREQSPIDVLFLCKLVPNKLGSYERFIALTAAYLGERGHTMLTVFAGEPCAEAAQLFRRSGMAWRSMTRWAQEDVFGSWSCIRPVLRMVRELHPKVVAMHFGNELPFVGLSLSSAFIPSKRARWVWHQHQRIRDPFTFFQLHLSRIRMASWVADGVVVNYRGGLRSMDLRHVNPLKVTMIHNGVGAAELRRPRGWLRSELALKESTQIVINVTSLIPRKRVDLTLRAFGELQRDCPDTVLIVVGRGEEELRLRALASELHIADKVHFLGLRNDARDILAESDVMVHTSQAETCTLAILEAMSAGIPCVVTNAGAAREMIDDGVSGFVVDDDNPATLATRLAVLLRNADFRRSAGAAGKARWAAGFTLERMARAHTELYERIANGECEL